MAINTTHLQRCSNPNCRAFVLNTDVKCSHCGTERVSLKVMRPFIALTRVAVILVTVLGILVWGYHVYSGARERRAESEAAVRRGLNP
jgi:hypothetical protein